MTIRNGLFSSESVSEGHPDKLADRISDRILDAFLARDPQARVACETMLADQCVIVAGEFKTRNPDDFHAVRTEAESLVREVLRETGYTSAETGIDPGRCEVQIRFNWHCSCQVAGLVLHPVVLLGYIVFSRVVYRPWSGMILDCGGPRLVPPDSLRDRLTRIPVHRDAVERISPRALNLR